jgi:hypothetical protein
VPETKEDPANGEMSLKTVILLQCLQLLYKVKAIMMASTLLAMKIDKVILKSERNATYSGEPRQLGRKALDD